MTNAALLFFLAAQAPAPAPRLFDDNCLFPNTRPTDPVEATICQACGAPRLETHRLCMPTFARLSCVFGGDTVQCTETGAVGFPTGDVFCFPASCQNEEDRLNCMQTPGHRWNPATCACEEEEPSPLLVSLHGNRMELTSAAEGVVFDIDADGIPERVAWTGTSTG